MLDPSSVPTPVSCCWVAESFLKIPFTWIFLKVHVSKRDQIKYAQRLLSNFTSPWRVRVFVFFFFLSLILNSPPLTLQPSVPGYEDGGTGASAAQTKAAAAFCYRRLVLLVLEFPKNGIMRVCLLVCLFLHLGPVLDGATQVSPCV